MINLLEELRWTEMDYAVHATNQMVALEMYRDELVRPSLQALDERLNQLERSEAIEDQFAHDDFAALHHATIEGYLLTTQSMFERGLRGMLVKVAERTSPSLVDKVKKAPWDAGQSKSIQAHFQALMAAPLDLFGCDDDLLILQKLGNALRHGDGRSAEELHGLCPSLWWNWLPPGATLQVGEHEILIPADAPRHPSFDRITLPSELLEQMMQAVLWFWQDIEFVRCNSFKNKHPTAVRMLAEMRAARPLRKEQRYWSRF
ncbi:hypothetical protein ABE493_00975 [Stenotrophomonas terrae]|uniref:hypothetical protein n=1 Tax=Stenotrophomonas terrae TaxID=405446 RepID=UPI003207AC18